jgi:thiol:disulfide interchange protein/DsbC/DsbD-like thiol-disulfide interchange protein
MTQNAHFGGHFFCLCNFSPVGESDPDMRLTLTPSLPHPSTHTRWHAARTSALFLIAACALLAPAWGQFSLKLFDKQSGPSAVVQTDQVRAELLAHAPDGLDAGKTIWVGLQLAHQPHWHTYWKNPGDSGLPTTLQWTLPPGVTAGEISWPTPQRIAVGSLANYGYEGTVLLPAPLHIGAGFAPAAGSSDVSIKLSASWLVCRQECIPQEGQFELRIPARSSTASHGAAFEAAWAANPKVMGGSLKASVDGDAVLLTATGLPAAWQGRTLQAFPELVNVLDAPGTPQASDTVANDSSPTKGRQVWQNGVWSARMPLSIQRDSSPTQLPFVLTLGNQGLAGVAPVDGAWPPLPDPAVYPAVPTTTDTAIAPSTSPAPRAATTASELTWALALLAAVVGGLILNLMPCVLPVLAIKMFSLVRHNQHSRASLRAQGVAYAAGVVLSFMALGGLMLALRATGEQLGWGFQLQSPAVVAGLAALFTLLALNLAGVFEIGHVLPPSLAGLQMRHPMVDSFLTGVLAVAVASPCTAPFMGASLGYAIGLPSAQALGIFAALGLGLALPFLAASWVPAVAHWLPKPGAWMDTLRHFMAFPMLATVVWLVWVLGHLSGVDGAASLLLLLLALALVAWSLGLRGKTRRVAAIISIAVSAGLLWAIGQNVTKMEPIAAASSATTSDTASEGAVWQAWAPGRVEAELAQGHPVFVDFTAAWCITCQYNKKTTLGQPAMLADFQARKVTLLRADWTRRDPAITLALEQLGRNGVPVYVLYQAGRAPVVFSEILSKQALHDALAQL